MKQRTPFTHYLAAMAAAGFRPSTSRGQNFLLDPSMHRWLAEQSGAGSTDTVVEIGVGLGFLTRELAAVAGHVIGIEIEPRLLEIARRELAGCDHVELLLTDAMSGPGRSLAPAIGAALRDAPGRGGRGLLVANLPYSISGPLLAEVAALPVLPERALLLVQKELAQRIAAPAGGADFGGLTVVVQSLFTAAVLRDVPPQVFRPRPKVMSSVVLLERRPDALPGLMSEASRREFASFVRTLFQQRRKVLRSTLVRAAAAIDRPVPELAPDLLATRAEEHGVDVIAGWWQAMQA
ncbi:MAG: ribosomal RNA small subunit methyltransferase A [Planctomycetes bacterium]|nr:ribosomal RNA small subunit methyltransferase A [Planctomycetota bacterium]